MKFRLYILLVSILLLSLFAGCTPADVPSTDDPSVDASVTDSSVSDTSSSETDGVISETNTEVASSDSSVTDIYTNIGISTDTNSSQETVEPLVKGSSLTNAEIGSIVSKIVFGETTASDVDQMLGKTKSINDSGVPSYLWSFENFSFVGYIYYRPQRTDFISRLVFVPQDGNVLVEKDVNQLLLAIGIDTTSEKPVVEESVDEKNKRVYTKYTYTLHALHGDLSVMVVYLCYPQSVPGHTPALIGTPYCSALFISPAK